MSKKEKSRFGLENKGIFSDERAAVKRRGIVDFAINNLTGGNEPAGQQSSEESEKKFAEMQAKMDDAFKELKQSQQKLKDEHSNLRAAEEQLELWHSKFDSLFNLAGVGLVTLYEDLAVKEANEAAGEIFGYKKVDMLGEDVVKFAGAGSASLLRGHLKKVFKGKTDSVEVELVGAGGKKFSALVQSALICEKPNEASCCLMSVVDNSALKELEQKLSQKEDELLKADKASRGELEALKQKLDDNDASKVDVEKQMAELDKKVEELSGDLTKARAVREDIVGQYEQSAERVQKLKDELARKENELAECNKKNKGDFDKAVSEAKEQLEKYESEKADLEKTVSEQTEQLGELKQQLNDKDALQIDIENQMVELKQKVEELSGDLVKAQAVREDLVEQCERSAERVQKLKDELARKESELVESDKKNKDEVEKAFAMANEHLEKYENEKAELENTISKQSRQVEELKQQLNDKDVSQVDVEKQTAELEQRVEELSGDLAKAIAVREDLVEQCEKSAEQVQRLMDELVQCDKQHKVEFDKAVGATKGQLEKYESEKADLEKTISEQAGQLEEVNRALAESKGQVDRFNDEKAGLENIISEQSRQVEELKRQLNDKGITQVDIEQQMAELQGKIKTLSDELSETQAVRDDLKGQCEQFEKLVKEQTFELARVKGELSQEANSLSKSEKAVEALNRSEAAGNVGSWEYDIEKERLEWSDQVYRIFGLPPQMVEVSYHDFINSVHEEDKEAVEKIRIDAFNNNESTQFDIDVRIIRPGGDVRDVHLTAEIEYDNESKAVGIFGTICDITELQQDRRLIAEFEERLRRTVEEKTAIIEELGNDIIKDRENYTALASKFNRLKKKFLTELEKRNERVRAVESKLNDMELTLGGKNNELQILNDKLADQINKARLEGNEHKKRSDWLNKKLYEAEDELASVQKELEVRTTKFESLHGKFNKERDELVGKLRVKSDELDFVSEELTQKRGDLSKTEKTLEIVRADLEKSIAERGELVKRLDLVKLMIRRLCDVGVITMSVYNVGEDKLMFVNRHIGESLGYSTEQIAELGGDIVNRLMHPDDKNRLAKDLAGFSWEGNGDELVDVQYRVKDAAGRWRYIHSQEMVLKHNGDGKAEQVLGVQMDFTDKVEAKRGLEALKEIVEIANNSR